MDTKIVRFPPREPVGAYRRAVRLRAQGDWSCAEMEDDVHHFEVVVRHDGERIAEVEALAPRTPWAICAGAVGELRRLHGLRLSDLAKIPTQVRLEHCLHLFDLALLAASHAGASDFSRLYLVELGGFDGGRAQARLMRDGAEVLGWRIEEGVIRGSRFDGIRLAELPARLAGLDPDVREAALVLRRASNIGFVRQLDLDAYPSAEALNPDRAPTCYAKQPGKRQLATRNFGSTRDFWRADAWPLASPGPAILPTHGDGPGEEKS